MDNRQPKPKPLPKPIVKPNIFNTPAKNTRSKQPWVNTKLIPMLCIDIETTGTVIHADGRKTEEFVQVVICKFKYGTRKVITVYDKKFKPLHKSTTQAQEIHGFTTEKLEKEKMFTPNDG